MTSSGHCSSLRVVFRLGNRNARRLATDWFAHPKLQRPPQRSVAARQGECTAAGVPGCGARLCPPPGGSDSVPAQRAV